MRLPLVLDILWARRLVVLTVTLGALAGGLLVLATSTPRYQASARVMLDYIKPDPLTGSVVPRKMVQAYVTSQVQMITDFQVTIPAAEALGLMDNPAMIESYAQLPGRRPDYRAWVASHLRGGISVVQVEDSNLLDIRFAASNPRDAEQFADAIRTAYIDATVATRRQGAEASAAGLLARADQLRAQMRTAQAKQAQIAQEADITMLEGRGDFDTRRLRQLVTEIPRPVFSTPEISRATSKRLLEMEAELSQASKVLGPNNPRLRALQDAVRVLKLQADQEASTAQNAGAMVAARERMTTALVEQQKAKVLDQRLTRIHLGLYQDLIDGYREQINSLTERAVELRQLATAKDTTVVAMGAATAKAQPSFPKPPLILGGSGGLGFVLGCALAILCELSARRVRTERTLAALAGAPTLGAIPLVRPSRAARPVRARPERKRSSRKLAA